MRVRLVRITGLDLNVFEFDWDLTWAVLFFSPDGKVLGRYGGRDASGADSRNSLPGLRYAMEQALLTHKEAAGGEVAPPPGKSPLFIERVPAAKQHARGCIHCHQVKEILRAQGEKDGTWTRDSIWSYPLPENLGITLDLDRGNLVRKVESGSPADRAGIRQGDWIDRLDGRKVRSFADATYALHKAPAQGKIPVVRIREGEKSEAELVLQKDWKRSNQTWRPSLLDLLPSLPLFGDDLKEAEKKKLGLKPEQQAFRQSATVHPSAEAQGVRGGDIVLGVDDKPSTMTVLDFLGYIRRNYLIGDRIVLNILRDGKRLDLPFRLK